MFGGYLPSAIFPRDCLLYWDGGPSDRINKTPLVGANLGASTLKHGASAVTFNGTTSVVNCGSEIVGTGNITCVAWINLVGYGESGFGTIVNNAKFNFGVYDTNACLYLQSEGATSVLSATNSILTATEYFVAATRTSSGSTNFYVNGVLSGTANQSSGTPEAGTQNLGIGAESVAQVLAFDGTISHLRVFSKILTTTQIGQIYNKER